MAEEKGLEPSQRIVHTLTSFQDWADTNFG